jgi:hypothetical protein
LESTAGCSTKQGSPSRHAVLLSESIANDSIAGMITLISFRFLSANYPEVARLIADGRLIWAMHSELAFLVRELSRSVSFALRARLIIRSLLCTSARVATIPLRHLLLLLAAHPLPASKKHHKRSQPSPAPVLAA